MSNQFDKLMTDILNQLSVNVQPLSFHSRNGRYNQSISDMYHQGNKPGSTASTKSAIPNINIAKTFTKKNINQLNDALLPLLDNKFSAYGNSTQTEIKKYYDTLKQFSKKFLIKLIDIQSNKTLDLSRYEPDSKGYLASYLNLIEIMADITKDVYFINNDFHVTETTKQILENSLRETISNLESDLEDVELLFNEKLHELEQKSKEDVHTNGVYHKFTRITSSGVSSFFASPIKELNIDKDKYQSNYFMFLIWLGRTLRYFYDYKGTQLSFDKKGLSELEHMTITLPTSLKICLSYNTSSTTTNPLLKSVCDNLGHDVKGSLIIMTFLKIIVCHNIEFLKNNTHRKEATFSTFELITEGCPYQEKLTPFKPKDNIYRNFLEFYKLFMLAVGTIGFKTCIDRYEKQEFISIKFKIQKLKEDYKKYFTHDQIIKDMKYIRPLLELNKIEEYSNDLIVTFNRDFINTLNEYYEILTDGIVNFNKFFEYLQITPECYKKFFEQHIVHEENDTKYPNFNINTTNGVEKEEEGEGGDDEEKEGKGDDEGDNGDKEKGGDDDVDKLQGTCNIFTMDETKYNKIKNEKHGWFFIEMDGTDDTNYEPSKNIFFTNQKKWYIYDNINEPSEIDYKDINGKTILPYQCSYNHETLEAYHGRVFTMLEKLTVGNTQTLQYMILNDNYINNDTRKIYNFNKGVWSCHNDPPPPPKFFSINNAVIDVKGNIRHVQIKYPSYPPFGKYQRVSSTGPGGPPPDDPPRPPGSGPRHDDPSSAGPSSVGPSSAGPRHDDPSSAGPSSVGPSSAGPRHDDPSSAGPPSAGPPGVRADADGPSSGTELDKKKKAADELDDGWKDILEYVSPTSKKKTRKDTSTKSPSTSTSASSASSAGPPGAPTSPYSDPPPEYDSDDENVEEVLQKAEQGEIFKLSKEVFDSLPSDTWYINLTNKQFIFSKEDKDTVGNGGIKYSKYHPRIIMVRFKNNPRIQTFFGFTMSDGGEHYNSFIGSGNEYIKISEPTYNSIMHNEPVIIDGVTIQPGTDGRVTIQRGTNGGSNIRKTIKKKYRKSKFITQKNRKNKKKISIKKNYIKKTPNFKKKI
jgi:hypothetical protein